MAGRPAFRAGPAQARCLGQRPGDDAITAAFTSGLARATQTAAIAFAGSHVPVPRGARLTAVADLAV
ncbi:MAG: histidine phosphatase family protein [Streptosporangiaceae bacterium]